MLGIDVGHEYSDIYKTPHWTLIVKKVSAPNSTRFVSTDYDLVCGPNNVITVSFDRLVELKRLLNEVIKRDEK